eukprot:CAMPEP_0181212006 /NCGR_PEP_ID=MMETSP1096-20121128/24107_1 /TAXON_ID=156174 ORGANISM="Chrysochromulina ericina, Strain CCMP281" /NCGR_SAMPLE_ID=MMETSP1096 /ASSEMBLY_ACC=CAM_ASM_000453 /LENGTH=64 /DNA_ID=CAMNT_0023303481 /DNA_START=242 /DNA_END=437 /DNA_ORIENTATION=-
MVGYSPMNGLMGEAWLTETGRESEDRTSTIISLKSFQLTRPSAWVESTIRRHPASPGVIRHHQA